MTRPKKYLERGRVDENIFSGTASSSTHTTIGSSVWPTHPLRWKKFSVQEFSCSGGTVSCCNSESYGGGEKDPLWIKWEKYKVINEKPKSSSIFPTYMFKRTFCLISDTFRLIWYILVESFCANRMKLRLTASNGEGKGVFWQDAWTAVTSSISRRQRNVQDANQWLTDVSKPEKMPLQAILPQAISSLGF